MLLSYLIILEVDSGIFVFIVINRLFNKVKGSFRDSDIFVLVDSIKFFSMCLLFGLSLYVFCIEVLVSMYNFVGWN